MKKMKGKKERKIDTVYQVKLRKKIITDIIKYPNVICNVNDIKKRVNEIISKEPEFLKQKTPKKEGFKGNNDNNAKLALNMDEGFLSNEKKKTSIFSCCKKCLNVFRRMKKYNEFEEYQK